LIGLASLSLFWKQNMKARQFLIEDVLPQKLLARLYGSEGSRPAAIEFPAAVMFIDVSRYTALVEQLARRGREGLEDLPSLLGLSYGRCSEFVAELGGEVLYFAGDSLIAYWAADSDEELGSAVRSAVACAGMICRSGNDGKRRGFSDISPALHVGIGAGPLWAAALGEKSLWNLIAGGAAITQAGASQAVARSWAYVMSIEAKEALTQERASPEIPSLHASDHSSRAPPLNWMAGFLPAQVRELLVPPNPTSLGARGPLAIDIDWSQRINTQLAALNEIRPISALFARVIGLDCADPLALSRHQDLCMTLRGIVCARGGPPGDLFYDDKGLIFSAVFGARGTFHRDDARRAVDASHAINEAVEQLGLSCSIGVATGDALFGFVGSMRRCQLMAHGAPINRAARLMMAHNRGILCDAPTERACRTGFRFEPKGTLQLVGLGDMAAVFVPREPHATTSSDGFLVGRRSELEVLDRTFEDARSGGKRLVILMGESGIGKSALVASFTEKLRSDGTVVAVARAERDDRRTSLLPWRRLLASLLNLASNSDGAVVLSALASALRSDQTILERLPLLAGMLGIEIPENENTRHLQGAHRGDATMRLVGELLGALAPRPLVLVLEDSHWLDSASWRLVEWVLATHSSVLLVLCVRSEEVPEELRSLQRRAEAARTTPSGIDLDDPARFCRVLTIEELSDAEIRELAARTLGTVPPEHELADRICTLACGNPLFAEEITLTLKSEGLVAIRDGLWRSIRPLDELRYFEGVERVIRERVDRLQSKLLDVLKAAAVIGRSFSLNALAVVLKVQPREEIRSALDFLASAHFVRRCATEDACEFRHDQIRDVVYASISADVRQSLHGILAEWLAQTGEATTGADIATLAQHFEAAGNNDKAVAYAEIAATRALQVGAFREVEALLGICFSHESRPLTSTAELRLRAVRWRIQLAEAQYCRGDIHAQGVAVRRALTLAGEPLPRSAASVVTRIAANSLWLLVQQMLPASRLLSRTELGRAWEREMSRCHSQAAMVDYFELRFLEGMRHLIEAVTHAERTGLTTELAVASSQLACGLGILGYRRICEYFIGKAERAAIALGDPAIHSHVCNLDALWRVGQCHWPVLDYRLKQAQELSLQAGDQLRWSNAQVIRFWSLFYRGDWSALEQTANGLLSRAQSSGNIQQEIWALRCKSLCALHADRPREAIEILRLITSAMLGSADLAAYVSSKGSLALALARTGLKDESLQAVDETLRMLRGMRRPTAHSTLVGIAGVCEVLLRGRETPLSREYDQWPEWESQALHELRRYSQVFPVGRAQYGLWTGVAHWLEGRKNQAFETWRQALSIAQRLSLRQDEAMIAAEIRRRQDRL
jgi:class 3 adenylate cyclase